MQQTEVPIYFQPYKNKRSFEEISNQIKGLIFKGVFKSGDRLPPESEIARQFNVSRQTVREALRILEYCGFITIQQGVNGGPFIVDTALDRLANQFIDIFHFKKLSADELTEARFDIESIMMRHVVERADGSDIEALQENVRLAKQKILEKQSAFQENIVFHKLLARATKNYIFVIVIESIMAVVSDFHSKVEKVDYDQSRKITENHEEIVNAITERNYERTVHLFEELLQKVRTILLDKH